MLLRSQRMTLKRSIIVSLLLESLAVEKSLAHLTEEDIEEIERLTPQDGVV